MKLSPLSFAQKLASALGGAMMLVAPSAAADGPISGGIGGGGPFGPGGPVVSHLTTVSKECSSGGYRLAECKLPGEIVMVELEARYSGAACTLDRSYGFRGDTLWVNSGCRAKFKVTYVDGPEVEENTESVNINCSSSRYRRTECAAPGPVVDVEVVRRDSGAACTKGSSFGFVGERIWVDKGCRAEFKVTFALPPVITPWP